MWKSYNNNSKRQGSGAEPGFDWRGAAPVVLGLIRHLRGGTQLWCLQFWAIRVVLAARFEARCVGNWKDREVRVV